MVVRRLQFDRSQEMLENLFSLEDKVVVVTGAAGLLGRYHAEAIAAYGGIPILLDLSLSKVTSLASKINKKFNSSAFGYAVDITDEEQVRKNSEHIVKKFNKIDGLINNAANNPKVGEDEDINFSRLENFPIENWAKDLAVGLTGSFICAKYYGTQISKNLNGGSIVNISSDLDLIGPDQRLYLDASKTPSNQPVKPVSYSVVKAGILGLTRYLATYWPEKKVRCNAICPAGVENQQDTSFIKNLSSRIPLNRMAQPNEYQGTVVWMLSDASSYLNGAIIPVDGGRTTW